MKRRQVGVPRRFAGPHAPVGDDGRRPGWRDANHGAGHEVEAQTLPPADVVIHSFGCGDSVPRSGPALGEVVLDLGCGTGIDLVLAAPKVGETGRVIGVDMRDALITCARANIRTSGFTNAEARAGSLEDLPVADESIDWVISNCAINLASDKPRVFAEIARVLKPGGQVRITDIVAEGVPGWLRHDDARHGSRIAGAASEQDYLAGLRSAGLEHISLGGRYVFDREQVAGLMGGAKISSAETVRLVDAVVGRMWSVHFSAGKPTFTNTGTR